LDLLAHIPRDQRDGRLHFGHDTLGFLHAIEARLAEAFLLGDGADRVDLVLDIADNQLPVATDPAIQVHAMVRLANGANTLANRLSRWREALALLASHCHLLFSLGQTWGALRRAPWTAPFWESAGTLGVCVYTVELRCSRRHGLLCGALLGGYGGHDSLAQLVLHMQEVWRVMRAEGMCHIREEPWRFVTRRLDHLAVEPCQGVLHQGVPGVLIARLGRVL
jgi:hypothetical protein